MKAKKQKAKKHCKLNKQEVLWFETYNHQKIPVYFKNLKTGSGYCYNPAGSSPQVIISTKLRKRRMLNVLIEEITHAFWYDEPEYKVRKFSAQLGKLVHKLFLNK